MEKESLNTRIDRLETRVALLTRVIAAIIGCIIGDVICKCLF